MNELAPVLLGLVDVVARVFFWGLVVLACARLAGRLSGSRLTGLAHVVWDGAVGLALLIALVLAAGVVPGGFHAATVRLVLLAWVGLAALATYSDPRARFRGAWGADTPTRGFALLLIVVALPGLAWDRVPPVFFDTRAYQFALPELWLIAGRVAPETWSLHSWFPPGMPLLYGVGLATGGERWANDANLVVGLGLVGAAFDLTRRLFGAGAGLVAAVLVTTLPLTLYALAIPAADLGHGLFVFGSLACLMLRSNDQPCWLKRAAILAAGAALTKYLGLIAPLALGTAWIALGSRSELAWRARIGSALRFAAPAVLLMVPWLASNIVAVGNPVAPVASSILATRGLAPGGAESFRGDARGGFPGLQDVAGLVPKWITGSEEDSRLYPTPAFGWLPLAIAPLALLGARDDRKLRTVLALTAVLVAVWFFTFRWERFLVAAGAFLSVGLAAGVMAASHRVKTLRTLPALAVVAAALSVVPPIVAIGRFNGGLRVACGLESADAFIEGGLASARLFRVANQRLDAARDRVLLLGEMRNYGLDVPRCAPSGFNTHPLAEALVNDPDPAEADRALRRLGFTYLIVDPGWVARSAARYPSLSYFREQPEILQRYLGSLGEPLAVEGQVALFRIPG
jgi:hypothetical protein